MREHRELPSSWIECTLGDVIAYGVTQKAEPTEIPPHAWVLELEDIERDTSRLLSRSTFSQRQSKSTKNRFERGDVLYGKLRPYLNKVIRADQSGYCTTEIVPLRPQTGLDGGYLFYWLKHPRFLEYVNSVSHGLNMPRLGTDAGKAAPFVLAPFPEQKRIADKLDALILHVDGCRDRLNRVQAILKRFRQAVLAAATRGDLTRDWREEQGLDHEWTAVELADVASDFSYGSSAKSAKKGKVPVLRMGNIQNGMLDWEDLVFTSDVSEIKKYELSHGDVLFNRTNSPELVGKTAVYRGERKAIYAGYLIRVRCGDRLLPDFLNYCLNSPAGRDYCWSVKSDGVSQSNINAKKLAAFSFGLPSISEQQEIVRRVENFFALNSTIWSRTLAASRIVETLTSSILKKAFRGELVSQLPNEETASVSLERLRLDRMSSPATKAPRRRKLAPRGVESTEKGILDVLTGQSEWITAEEAFRRCGVQAGVLTDQVELLYAELRELDRAGLLEVRQPRVGASDQLRLKQRTKNAT